MLDPKQLEALAAVVESGGFDKASERLFITQSAVSQRIRQLEDRLGQPVVTRTTPVGTTAVGRRLLQHYHQVSLLETELFESVNPVGQTQAWTRIALGVNYDSLATWFLSAVSPVLKQHRLLLDVLLDDQDYTMELMRQGYALGCISTRAKPIQGGECLTLGVMRYYCLASPEFARHYFSEGFNSKNLADAPAIIFNAKDDLHSVFLTEVAHYQGDFPRLTLPLPHSFVDAALLGLAYGLIPHSMAARHLESGGLIDLCPGQYIDLTLYWHHWRSESSVMREVAAALAKGAKDILLLTDRE
jgi:LysR family transcriptional regulator (chromosome initiation inhibitor)